VRKCRSPRPKTRFKPAGMRRLRTTRRPGKKEKSTPRPRFQKPEPGAPSDSRYFLETCRSVILSPTVMSTTSDPGPPANFAQFGNYSRWGGLESVTFSPPSGMGPGSTIPITVSVFGFTQDLSVNVQSMNSQSMTFTTNPGHLLYPASITFAASPASPGSINFNINLGGTVANPTEFTFVGSAFEDAQWNHFLGKVVAFCKAGG